MWVLRQENITFAVKFDTGSHVSTTFGIEGIDDVCLSEDVNKSCQFPFRYQGQMFYGCTPDEHMCAIATDIDFEEQGMANCSDNCVRQGIDMICMSVVSSSCQQCHLPAEIPDLGRRDSDNAVLQEGTGKNDTQIYFKSEQTQLQIQRTFENQGQYTNVSMTAYNLHDTETERYIMTWMVMVAVPVHAESFDLSYENYSRPNENIKLDLMIMPNATLPTEPTLRIKRVNGGRVTYPQYSVLDEETIPFKIGIDEMPTDDSPFIDSYTFEGFGLGNNMTAGNYMYVCDC